MKILLIISSLVLVSCSGGRNSTGYSIINDMMYSETHEPFSDSKVFPNGQTNQLAQPNTIARGFMPHPKAAEGEDYYGMAMANGQLWKNFRESIYDD